MCPWGRDSLYKLPAAQLQGFITLLAKERVIKRGQKPVARVSAPITRTQSSCNTNHPFSGVQNLYLHAKPGPLCLEGVAAGDRGLMHGPLLPFCLTLSLTVSLCGGLPLFDYRGLPVLLRQSPTSQPHPCLQQEAHQIWGGETLSLEEQKSLLPNPCSHILSQFL